MPYDNNLLSKYGFSDVYRQIFHRASSAVQTILACREVLYIILWLLFGGLENPSCSCGFSEMLTDLSDELFLLNKDWDPDKLKSPLQPLVPDPVFEGDSLPLMQGKKKMPLKLFGEGRILYRWDC